MVLISQKRKVAPYAGAWIEIILLMFDAPPKPVAPYAGAWIEIMLPLVGATMFLGRSLRGSVD